ncbi:MAG: serine hydrolase domain-containing protein [Anaerolineales bacterium]|jgi:CubicO group peptidase (beta-lactamase class C family)
MNKKIVASIFLLIGLTLSGCNPSGPETEIAAYLEDLAEMDGFSGVALVAREGEPVLELAYGLANRDHDIPNQMDTKFNLGSMNKMFTAVAILQFVQQEKLDLEDTFLEYLPDYPNQEIARQVTIHHLLTHTSGMGDFFTEAYFESPKDRFRVLEDYLPLFVDQPLQFDPGSQFSYSNAGYLVLGLIIEEIAGHSYYDHVRESIFEPCGMEHTDSYAVDDVVPSIATGYTRLSMSGGLISSNVYFLPARGSSAGGGYSTAGDLLNFSNCLMNYQLLNTEYTQLLLEPKIEFPELGESVEYGYGIIVRTCNGFRVVGHSGGSLGVCSNLDIIPDLGYTVVVLTNGDFDCKAVRTEIREILTQ